LVYSSAHAFLFSPWGGEHTIALKTVVVEIGTSARLQKAGSRVRVRGGIATAIVWRPPGNWWQ
jgi:hypothetical protein